MDRLIGMTARMTFRSFVICMLILNLNKEAVCAFPIGLIIGLCSEAEALTKK